MNSKNVFEQEFCCSLFLYMFLKLLNSKEKSLHILKSRFAFKLMGKNVACIPPNQKKKQNTTTTTINEEL